MLKSRNTGVAESSVELESHGQAHLSYQEGLKALKIVWGSDLFSQGGGESLETLAAYLCALGLPIS